MIIGPTDLSDEDVIFALETALATELDIHPSELDVSFDRETGLVTYVISSDEIESVMDAIVTIADEDFISNLDIGEDIRLESVAISDNIVVTVDVVVDASNVADVNLAVDDVMESIRNQDDTYQITSQRTYKYLV